MKSNIDWCNITKHDFENNDDIYSYYVSDVQSNKMVYAYMSGGYGCFYDDKPIFYTDILELAFAWLNSNIIEFQPFINREVTLPNNK